MHWGERAVTRAVHAASAAAILPGFSGSVIFLTRCPWRSIDPTCIARDGIPHQIPARVGLMGKDGRGGIGE
jgi:hypothetical protein